MQALLCFWISVLTISTYALPQEFDNGGMATRESAASAGLASHQPHSSRPETVTGVLTLEAPYNGTVPLRMRRIWPSVVMDITGCRRDQIALISVVPGSIVATFRLMARPSQVEPQALSPEQIFESLSTAIQQQHPKFVTRILEPFRGSSSTLERINAQSGKQSFPLTHRRSRVTTTTTAITTTAPLLPNHNASSSWLLDSLHFQPSLYDGSSFPPTDAQFGHSDPNVAALAPLRPASMGHSTQRPDYNTNANVMGVSQNLGSYWPSLQTTGTPTSTTTSAILAAKAIAPPGSTVLPVSMHLNNTFTDLGKPLQYRARPRGTVPTFGHNQTEVANTATAAALRIITLAPPRLATSLPSRLPPLRAITSTTTMTSAALQAGGSTSNLEPLVVGINSILEDLQAAPQA